MRHEGAISQVNIERDKEVFRLYRKAKSLTGWPTSRERLCEIAASLPVPKFYISGETAVGYVRNRLFGKEIRKFSNKYKQRLFEALYEKVMDLRGTHHFQDKPLSSIVEMALKQPAPCCGLGPHRIYFVLLGRRKREHKKQH